MICAGIALALWGGLFTILDDKDVSADVIAATVDGQPVFRNDVLRELHRVLKDRPLEGTALAQLQATTLQRCVDRQIILLGLAREQQAASKQDIDLAVEQLTKRLESRDQTLAEFLKRNALDLAALRRDLAWQISWDRYLKRLMTDENLDKYFEKNRRHFDGTRLRVAHILFEIADGENSAAVEAAVSKAMGVRQEIVSKKLTFAEAAQKYSAAPTGKDGGEIGFIGRLEPMPESFSKATFILEKGDVSQPVVSPFGVHLIQWLELKPGQITRFDAGPELKEAMTQFLFVRFADKIRGEVTINFTGALPHFKPGTSELAP